jgi:hypothetical protein
MALHKKYIDMINSEENDDSATEIHEGEPSNVVRT